MLGCAAFGAVAAVGVIGFLVVVDQLASRRGCGFVDPTDAANYSSVAILNDTAAAVIVDQCEGGYCSPDRKRSSLSPGRRLEVDAACGVSGADATSWRVSTPAGGPIGYIVVATPRKHDGLVYPVSHAVGSRTVDSSPEP